MTHVEHIIAIIKLGVRPQYQNGVYVIIVMHAYLLKEP